MTGLQRSLIGATVGFVLFAGVSLLATKLYYRFMPGDWFIDYYYSKIDDTTVGSDVQGTLCRIVRGTNLRINATRSFLLRQEDGKFTPAGEYEFTAGIEQLDDTNCQPIRILAANHPKKAGTYKIFTEADFVIKGEHKTIRYETPTYKLTESKASLQAQIDELQRQIDELKKQQAVTKEEAPTTVAPKPNQDAQTTRPLREPGQSGQGTPPEQPTQEAPTSLLPLVDEPIVGCIIGNVCL